MAKFLRKQKHPRHTDEAGGFSPEAVGPGPCTKKGYDLRTARTALNSRMRDGHRERSPDFLRIYQCEKCNAWHLTHRK